MNALKTSVSLSSAPWTEIVPRTSFALMANAMSLNVARIVIVKLKEWNVNNLNASENATLTMIANLMESALRTNADIQRTHQTVTLTTTVQETTSVKMASA